MRAAIAGLVTVLLVGGAPWYASGRDRDDRDEDRRYSENTGGDVRDAAPDSNRGPEVGGRIEWRWNRFSFALADFNGYADLSYPDSVAYYERNVDLSTGRPLLPTFGSASLTMRFAQSPNVPDAFFSPGAQNPLELHYANQQLFRAICNASVAVSNIAPGACAFDPPNPQPGWFVPGRDGYRARGFADSRLLPFYQPDPFATYYNPMLGLRTPDTTLIRPRQLTPECVSYDGTPCDPAWGIGTDGVVNPVIGARGFIQQAWLTTSAAMPQPGAVIVGTGEMFPLGATCTYYNEETGALTTLPGCRDASAYEISFQNGYLPREPRDPIDFASTTRAFADLRTPLRTSWTDPDSVEMFDREAATLSFNLQMFLVAISCRGEPEWVIEEDPECFDPARPYRPDRCSFAAPQFCAEVSAVFESPPQVAIDVEPGRDDDRVLYSRRNVRVAILGSESVDVRDVDVTTLRFGPDGALPKHDLEQERRFLRHLRDANRDGFEDLMTHFRVWETGLALGDVEACLRGVIDGWPFAACTSVRADLSERDDRTSEEGD